MLQLSVTKIFVSWNITLKEPFEIYESMNYRITLPLGTLHLPRILPQTCQPKKIETLEILVFELEKNREI